MKILDLHILNGPNYWSARKHKLIVIKLDLEELEELPTNKLDGFYDRIRQSLPSLYNHYCSEGHPGGFLDRVKNGTWMGHVMEHIALEIQTLAGMSCGFGRTRQAGQQKGIYNVVFEYHEEQAGIFAAESAFRITLALINNEAYNIREDIDTLRSLYTEFCLGPSTTSIVEAATKMGIPHMRLDNASLVQLGYGIHQKRINSTISEYTSNIAVDIACDKELTKKLLKAASVPVPEGFSVSTEKELEDAIRKQGYPLVIKPRNGNHGNGVTTNIKTHAEALLAFRSAKALSDTVIMEKYYEGNDYRLLLIDYRLCAAARRIPALVTGDGFSNIRTLIEKENRNPQRGSGHEKILTRIKIDDNTLAALRYQHLTPDSIPPMGQTVYVKQTANLSTGGTSEDVTDYIHPETVKLAERIARSIGLDICGIDMVLKDVSAPVKSDNGAVIEVNAAPGFRMHTHPFKGKPRQVGENVVRMLFPHHHNARIPITAITGTNGKTTTARILAFMARSAGYNVGYTTTEGVFVGDQLIEEGDCTGPVSASKVLQDKTVDFAVLECARGGILRAGLAFDQCDIGIVTNVAEDHIGLKDIDTVEEMARVKSLVVESVRADGYAILNADNDYTYAMRERLKCNVALFSTNPQSEQLRQHIQEGELVATYEKGNIILIKGKKKIQIETVENIPLSFNGRAIFMIENILAATLAAFLQNISVYHISQALRTFVPTSDNNPGRLNIFHFSHLTLMIDYAHNYHGMMALGKFIAQWGDSYKVGIVSVAGDRRDVDIVNFGRASAEVFDRIIIRIDEDKRGRQDEELIGLLKQGIEQVNSDKPVEVVAQELDAIRYALQIAPEGSLVVHLSEKVKNCIAFAKQLQQEEFFKQEGLEIPPQQREDSQPELQHQMESTMD
jgi:cyanophycin synthetase